MAQNAGTNAELRKINEDTARYTQANQRDACLEEVNTRIGGVSASMKQAQNDGDVQAAGLLALDKLNQDRNNCYSLYPLK